MYSQVWKTCHPSVCQLNFINERGVSVDVLTGFKVKNYLVTSQYAFCVEKAHKVEITFVGADANTVTASMRIPYAEFNKEHRVGVFNSNGHYAIFNIDLHEFDKIPGLNLCERRNFSIGSQVASLSFNCGSSNLFLKTGFISSINTNPEGMRFIQVDGQLCYGNSGAPLIDPKTFEVIGIVSRRNTPAANSYRQLMEIITANLNELKKVQTAVKFGEIDPFQVLIANQNQLKLLATNIYKYSVSSTSQAVTLDRIISFFNEDAIRQDVSVFSSEEESDIYKV
jgi:hypothetical protein